MKKNCFLLLMLMCCFNACSDDEECTRKDMAVCSEDGLGVKYCLNGKWRVAECDTGMSCANVDGMVQCFDVNGLSAAKNCTAGSRQCAQGLVQICTAEKVWRYETCPSGQTCVAGQCAGSGTTPDIPEPQKEYHGIVSRVCSDDGKGIVTTDAQGKNSTASCLELVGFDTRCEAYNHGHVGCAIPTGCDETFSEAGTCQGERLLGCDMRYVVPRPYEMDCAVQGMHCSVYGGRAECRQKCDSASDFVCVTANEVESVQKCASVNGQNVLLEGVSLCKDGTTAVSCFNGEVQETVCGDSAKCLEGMGQCVTMCTADQIGDRICSDAGLVLECQEYEGEYAYLSRGTRHCDGDMLYRCEADVDGARLKSVDCANYDHEGEIIHGHCVINYNGYEDVDMCIAGEEGEPCGDLTEEGRCVGNTLEYCEPIYQVVYQSDCGRNVCSMYAGYADCRPSCSASGAAACSYDEQYGQYVLSLCAPDDENGTLTRVDGTGICMGDVLYECSADGDAVTTNCALNGGRCDAMGCVYPACELNDKPVCFADNAILACQVDDAGTVIGSSLETMICSEGKCQVCKDGKLVDAQE